MPTKLVTIRIDTEIHQTARELGLNISKTCENCLKQAIQRLTSPITNSKCGEQSIQSFLAGPRGFEPRISGSAGQRPNPDFP